MSTTWPSCLWVYDVHVRGILVVLDIVRAHVMHRYLMPFTLHVVFLLSMIERERERERIRFDFSMDIIE